MYSGMAERIVHGLTGDIELSGLEVGRMRLEVFDSSAGQGAAGGGEGGKEAVVWGGFIWVGVGEIGIVSGVVLAGRRVDGVFGSVCHSEESVRRRRWARGARSRRVSLLLVSEKESTGAGSGSNHDNLLNLNCPFLTDKHALFDLSFIVQIIALLRSFSSSVAHRISCPR